MTYNDDGVFDTAYTYGNERIGIDILDGTRPDAQNPLYYLYDGEGSVSYITKPDGEIRDTYKYDEFGKPKTGKLSPDGDKILHTSFGYTGEQWDEESQLQYLRARYYDPEVGRFINRDTYQGEIENPLSKNLYVYVQNNPVNYSDPSGNKRVNNYQPEEYWGNLPYRVKKMSKAQVEKLVYKKTFLGLFTSHKSYKLSKAKRLNKCIGYSSKGHTFTFLLIENIFVFMGVEIRDPDNIKTFSFQEYTVNGHQFLTGVVLYTGGIEEPIEGIRKYEPSPKHDPKSGWGSPNPIPNSKIGQQLLDSAYSSSKNKQLYNVYKGKIIKFQPDGRGWHPYQVANPAAEVPADVLRKMLNDGLINKTQYNKWLKNK